MERVLIDELHKWKNKSDRKPLILRGARQVGKTWLLKDFGKKFFKDVCYINFEQKDVLGAIFEGTLSPQRIIEQLSVYSGKKIQPADTLLIFDEVQEMPRALTSLKYFAEEAPEYAICCAGSLLGVALHEGTSFPVGKVEFLDLYPLSFREFLLANGEEMLLDYILNDGHRDLAAFTEKLTDYLKKYFVIGGMPSAVLKWLDTHDFFEVDDVQKQLLAAYENDFSKHAPRQMIEKIRYVWDSIPSQLAKENKKFIYGAVRKGARAADFELAIQWLVDAGIVHRVPRISEARMPLKFYASPDAFKMFLLDCGLLGCMTDTTAADMLIDNKVFTEFKGAFAEQFVAQELVSLGIKPYYWSNDRTPAEINFIIQHNGKVVPIEVKASTNVRSKSLAQFIKDNGGLKGLRLSLCQYIDQEWMENVPLYALSGWMNQGE